MYLEQDSRDYYIVGAVTDGEFEGERIADLPTRSLSKATKMFESLKANKFPDGFHLTDRKLVFDFGKQNAIFFQDENGYDLIVWFPKAFGLIKDV